MRIYFPVKTTLRGAGIQSVHWPPRVSMLLLLLLLLLLLCYCYCCYYCYCYCYWRKYLNNSQFMVFCCFSIVLLLFAVAWCCSNISIEPCPEKTTWKQIKRQASVKKTTCDCDLDSLTGVQSAAIRLTSNLQSLRSTRLIVYNASATSQSSTNNDEFNATHCACSRRCWVLRFTSLE